MNNFNNFQQNQPQQGYGYGVSYGMPQTPMMGYNNAPQKNPEYTNPLGAEKIKERLSRGAAVQGKLTITEEDFDAAICTHRFNGKMELVDLNDDLGTHKCRICGEEFVPIDVGVDIKDVVTATNALVNILNTAKMAWLDIPEKTAIDYFQALAVIKKTPEVFKFAMRNFSEHTGYNMEMQNNNNISGFQAYNHIMGPQYGVPQYAAPQYSTPPQQPYMAPAPQGYQGYGYQPTNYGGYNNAAMNMQGGAPGVSGFGFHGEENNPANRQQPNNVQQQSQPQANTGEAVTKTLKA